MADTRRPANKTFALVFLGVVVVLGGVAGFQADYLETRKVIDEGESGTFTLERCEQVGGTDQGPDTWCYGTFRSDDGSVVLEDIRLAEGHDARGMTRGESFPAHGLDRKPGPDKVVRSDEAGTANLTTRSVGWAGAVLLGLALLAFGVRDRLPAGAGRDRLSITLRLATVGGALTWLIGLGVGGGFRA